MPDGAQPQVSLVGLKYRLDLAQLQVAPPQRHHLLFRPKRPQQGATVAVKLLPQGVFQQSAQMAAVDTLRPSQPHGMWIQE